jgi:hypothetical protein
MRIGARRSREAQPYISVLLNPHQGAASPKYPVTDPDPYLTYENVRAVCEGTGHASYRETAPSHSDLVGSIHHHVNSAEFALVPVSGIGLVITMVLAGVLAALSMRRIRTALDRL